MFTFPSVLAAVFALLVGLMAYDKAMTKDGVVLEWPHGPLAYNNLVYGTNVLKTDSVKPSTEVK